MKPLALIYHPDYLQHETGTHPENQKRLKVIMNFLKERGYLNRLDVLTPEPAIPQHVHMVHISKYVSEIASIAQHGGDRWDWDTIISPKSYEVALLAAGGTILAVEKVVRGEYQTAWALVRPPGHHAEPDRAMGFCLFNNVAIAARYAQKVLGLKRILIVDWDVHHGNGTQTAFWNDSSVLFFSVHQKPLYPGTGAAEESGGAEAKGYTVNVPLPPGTGDSGYRYAFENILIPIAEKFKPQLVMVSAGLDAHYADPLANMNLTNSGFKTLTALVCQLADSTCQGKVVLALEGGYNLDVLPYTVASIISQLTGSEDLNLKEPEPAPPDRFDSYLKSLIDKISAYHKQFWI
ncbi:histone deacetylase family protein [Calderihabitans maritimus]|uniref:Histone deacetylase family protein n=1 Tax=Calderihabitans maritimus TaxID=1246530 RepID=A0A1Z5HRG3_9FIRM|nr:histone deacetylase [Calderihabitans maritimus]GAW91957.1 Histone deacetylase family protein [Calderihabitans maritimus]